jgi:predicted HicB family RNase H-like nuclease
MCQLAGQTGCPSSPWQAKKANIRQVVADVVKDLAANGENVPEPLASKKFSGKFQVRVTADTHRALAIKAAERNVSLNRLVSESLASSC